MRNQAKQEEKLKELWEGGTVVGALPLREALCWDCLASLSPGCCSCQGRKWTLGQDEFASPQGGGACGQQGLALAWSRPSTWGPEGSLLTVASAAHTSSPSLACTN